MRSADEIVSELCGDGGRVPGLSHFFSNHYKDHNRARLAHLASIGLPLENRTVLEVGSGPGDHTEFYLARACRVLTVDARRECLDYVQRRFPGVRVACIDMNHPSSLARLGTFEVVHCYGLLYHLENPGSAVEAMAQVCSDILVLETCVSPGREWKGNSVAEHKDDFTQAVSGRGCRPTRWWVFAELRKHFQFVYQTRTQPDHPEFPLDWTKVETSDRLIRAVFVASRHPLNLPTLSNELLEQQVRMAPLPSGDRGYHMVVAGCPELDEEQAFSEHPVCWCGGEGWEPFHRRYFRCRNCGTVHLRCRRTAADWAVDRDEIGIGGNYPWAAGSVDEAPAYEADWRSRAAALSERNLTWLRTLLTYSMPGRQVLAVGSPHESFVTLMRLAGFAVTVQDPRRGEVRDGQELSGTPPAGGLIGRDASLSRHFDAVVAMEVMKRSPEPLSTMRRCAELLRPGGFLMAEAACVCHGKFSYRDLVETNDPLLPEVQQEASRHLFTPESIAMFAAQLGFPHVVFEGTRLGRHALFVAGSEDLRARANAEIADSLLASRNGRVVLALLDLGERLIAEKRQRQAAEIDRAVLAQSRLDSKDECENALRTAEERLSALVTTDAALQEIHKEAKRRAEGMVELTAAIEARDARIRELERTAEERLKALLETDAALRRERATREP